MTRQHVKLTLGKMRRDGLVKYGRGSTLVVNTQRPGARLS
jgi:hypothetical protein